MSYIPIDELSYSLVRFGLPVSGVTIGNPPTISSWKTPPTPVQVTQANSICASFDMRPRNKKTPAEITTEIAALSIPDKFILANQAEVTLYAEEEFVSRFSYQVAKAILTLNMVVGLQKRDFLLSIAVVFIRDYPRFCDNLGMTVTVVGSKLA